MALTQEQVKEYKEKLKSSTYMETAINSIAGKFLDVGTPAVMPDVKLNMNNTEEKRMARLTLNEHLFEVLENLTDKSVKGEELDIYIKRAEATVKVSQQIIANNNTILSAVKIANECGIDPSSLKEKLKLITE